MKMYVQFFQMSYNYDGAHPSRPIEACGDRSVIILDARSKPGDYHAECKARGYVGYEIRRASGFNRPHSVAVPYRGVAP